MYSRELLDHFEHPRNAGILENPDASAQAENPVCGDVLRLTASLRDGKIDLIRFQAKGCVPAIACGSALTELVLGKGMDEAATLRAEDVIARVGGVPAASTHASHLAVDALAKLLYVLRSPRSY